MVLPPNGREDLLEQPESPHTRLVARVLLSTAIVCAAVAGVSISVNESDHRTAASVPDCSMADGAAQVVFHGVDRTACQAYRREFNAQNPAWRIGNSLNAVNISTYCVVAHGPLRATVTYDRDSLSGGDDALAVCGGLRQMGWSPRRQ